MLATCGTEYMGIADIEIFSRANILLTLIFLGINKSVTEQQTNEIDERIAAILEKFPFLSYGKIGNDHYLGIIQNSDNQFISMYILDLIPGEDLRKVFLELGDRWWWESNRKIPINVFIKDPRFKSFRVAIRMFSAKDFDLLAGHKVSLADTMQRRIRKRQITLVRKMD